MEEKEEKKDLGFFFDPGSVAVIGATEEPGKLSGVIMESLAGSGFKGKVYPINPKYDTVSGLDCYPSLGAIGSEVDLAVFAIPAKAVPGALREAAGKIRGAIVIGGGFGDAGGAGRGLEREIKEIARQNRVRVMGPNCMGVYDATTGLDTFFIPSDRMRRPKRGTLSIVSQSGSFAITAMDELVSEGVGVARVVSYGNKADVDEADLLEFLAADPATGAVALYIESVDEGRRFVEAAARCVEKKPVMAIKAGHTGAAVTAARSHTGAMAGRYEIYRAAFKKAGIIELGGYEEFIDGCKAFGSASTPVRAAGPRVMIITDGGGMGINTADACLAAGLDVPQLEQGLVNELRPSFPPYCSISNPMDLTGSVTDQLYADAIGGAMSTGAFDIAIVALLWGPPGLTDALPALIVEKAVEIGKPVIICSPGGAYTRGKAELLRESGFAVFSSPESAVRAASVLARGGRGPGGPGGAQRKGKADVNG